MSPYNLSIKKDDLYYILAVIFSHFNGQLTERVTQVLESQSVLIPAVYTGELQPIDIS